jgi:hypothetical protein
MLIVAVVDLFVPRIRLVITAEFNGILPRETREKARAAKTPVRQPVPRRRSTPFSSPNSMKRADENIS